MKKDVDSAFWKAASKLKDGEYTTSPVESEYGYYIILRKSSKKKDSLSKIKDKVKDVLFSSLIPYINNMNEIKLDKRIILKLLDEVTEKYKYLDESSIKNLEGFISQSQEEIKQFRKE